MIYGQNALKILNLVRDIGAVPEPVIFAYIRRNAKQKLISLTRERLIRKAKVNKTIWYFDNKLPNNLYYHTIKAWFAVRWLQLGGTIDDNAFISQVNQRFDFTVVDDKAVISGNGYRYYATLDDLQTKKDLNTYLRVYPPQK
jgi:hypothetical protein